MSILAKIVKTKAQEIEANKAKFPVALLETSIYFDAPTLSLSQYIKREDMSGIIAEFKRKSPSRPNINLYADVEEVTMGYMQNGASALSVLTDKDYFGGSAEDLKTARTYNYCPILRKDFIIDEYQILEARSIGADAILLIAEILEKNEVAQLASFAHSLGLEVLLEMHSTAHLDKITEHVQNVGINNRDLTTFTTDIQRGIDMIDQLPKEVTKIAESGIRSGQDIAKLRTAGFDGFLIGEAFMKHQDPALALRQILQEA